MTTNQNGNFTGKVAFVTGAAGGIGRATALAFAREGASLVAADVSGQDNQETARMIEELGGRALAIRCDVTRAEDVNAALDTTIETFGGLDVAFNNAGIEQPTAATADITEEEWDRVVAINLRGVFLSHEARDSADAQAWGRRDREHILGRRAQGLRRRSRRRRREIRRHRRDQVRGPRLRRHPASASTPSAPASSTPT